MFYSLKKKVMISAINKRNKDRTFSYQKAEGYSINGIEDPLINNSYYFSAHNKEISIFARLGQRVNKDETWLVIYHNGKSYCLDKQEYPAREGPIKVVKEDKSWKLTFKDRIGEVEVELDATFVSEASPIDFSSDMPSIRMAVAMANEKWKRDFFSSLDKIQGQVHYEQIGTLKGSFRIDRETMPFSLPCVRDHSFGKREWDYMNNHLWLMGVEEGTQFNYSLVSYPVMSILEVGNYLHNGKQRFMLSSDLNLSVVATGKVPESLTLKISYDDKSEMEVKAKVIKSFPYSFENGNYLLYENIAEFEMDGLSFRGILEIGYNKDSGRYFNARPLERLKRK
ncbi:MAG: hypothetical protein K6B65_05295 [Bacilli bacterium]|nr:hypothetical protein [Bacilli bacterium]